MSTTRRGFLGFLGALVAAPKVLMALEPAQEPEFDYALPGRDHEYTFDATHGFTAVAGESLAQGDFVVVTGWEANSLPIVGATRTHDIRAVDAAGIAVRSVSRGAVVDVITTGWVMAYGVMAYGGELAFQRGATASAKIEVI